MDQTALPLEMNCYLPENHIVYSIHQVVEDLDDSQYHLIENDFGRPAYHPKVLLKTRLLTYSDGIFPCRKIEKMMQKNISMQ
ncbi:transposase [Marinilactibacillus sp. 15R]|uniref:transposase n=1 Tax=Marinilactibacillus sp. 15R TaxID=1911586 RepID=UPI0018DC69E7|nr:transposase [Marinilactibacillus sp. 15R]